MTGGWTPNIADTNRGGYGKAAEYLRLYATNAGYYGDFNTAKSIDFTRMRTLKVTYIHSGWESGTYAYARIDESDKFPLPVNNTAETVSFNVFDLSGKHTVGLRFRTGGGAGGALPSTPYLHVYKIELSQ